MACCGRQAPSARESARTASGTPVTSTEGLDYTDPVVLGDLDGSLLRVQVARIGIHPALIAGQTAWVTGTDVAGLISDGSLVDLSNRRLAQRMWRVGSVNYVNYQQAVDASTATGLPIVEVS